MDEFVMALTEADERAAHGQDDDGALSAQWEKGDAEDTFGAEEDTEGKLSGQAGADQAESGEADGAQETFCLRHLDRDYTVSREQAVALAQKGLDYDRIRADRDSLRQYKQQADPAYALAAALAGDAGMTVPDYLRHAAGERLIKGGVEPELARQQAQQEYAVMRAKAEQQELYTQFPDAELNQLPEAFWQEVKQGKSLLSAYLMHENTQLKARIDAENQQQSNHAAAASSRRSAGDSAAGDAFLTEFMRD